MVFWLACFVVVLFWLVAGVTWFLMFAFGLCVGYCVSVLLLRLIALRWMLLRSDLC